MYDAGSSNASKCVPDLQHLRDARFVVEWIAHVPHESAVDESGIQAALLMFTNSTANFKIPLTAPDTRTTNNSFIPDTRVPFAPDCFVRRAA